MNSKKLYYQKNKEKLKTNNYIYKLEHIDEIIESNTKYKLKNYDKLHEKFDCLCGGSYIYNNKAKHFKTKKHQSFLLNSNTS